MIFLDLLFCNAQKKLNTLADAHHSDEEIDHRLTEIDDDLRNAEDVLLHNLSFRALLRP